MPINDAELGLVYNPIRASTVFGEWSTTYQFAPGVAGRLDVALSRASGRLYRDFDKWADSVTVAASGSASPADTAGVNYTYNTSGFVPTLALTNPAAVSSPGSYGLDYLRQVHFGQISRVFEVHPSLAWNAGPQDQGFGMRLGAQYTRTSVDYRETYVEYDPKIPGQYPMSLVLQQTKLTLPAFGGIPFPTINRGSADALLSNILANTPASLTAINETTADNANGFDIHEETAAGYATALWRTRRLTVEAGLRYDSTRDAIASLQQVSNGVYGPSSAKNGYAKLLPAGVVTYKITPDLIGHLAYSETLGRPDFSSYGPVAKVGQPAGGSVSVTLGNAAIAPRETKNYDASIDFYFDRHKSLISLQYFHKDFANEFYNRLYSGPYVYNGATYVGNFTQPTNGATAEVNGLEINISKDRLPFVPRAFGDVGVSVNYTWLGTDFHLLDSTDTPRTVHQLVNQPRDILNASIFYTYGLLDIAMTFNRQGTTLYQTGYTAWTDEYILPRNQLDLSAHLRVTPRLTVVAEASNLTGAPFQSAVGLTRALVADDYKIGTVGWVGVSFKY